MRLVFEVNLETGENRHYSGLLRLDCPNKIVNMMG